MSDKDFQNWEDEGGSIDFRETLQEDEFGWEFEEGWEIEELIDDEREDD